MQAIRPGEAAGILTGGTLTQLAASLGTPYAFDPPRGHILFIDEVGERPYRIDRLLTQLRFAGILDRAAAVVFGELPRCDEPQAAGPAGTMIREVVGDLLEDFRGPVLFGLPSGHTTGACLTLPFGVRTRVDRRQPSRRSSSRRRQLTKEARAHEKVHLIGVCGTAMATLAAMLKTRGYDVRGSDQNMYPPMSDFLAEQQITTLQGYQAEHITGDLDLVVVGNAISRGNPELEEVLDRKIRFCSLPEAIRDHFLWGARSVVIAGTHGKTTTTSLTGWLLTHGGTDPSVLIGGIAENFGGSYRVGGGREFVIEGDEYDSAFFDKTAKFLKYLPDIAVVNNIEYDHADIYPDLEAIRVAFRRLREPRSAPRAAAARRRRSRKRKRSR